MILMRLERVVYGALILALALIAAVNWRRAELFKADNETLRATVEELELETERSGKQSESFRVSLEKMREQSSELLKLRGEVTQLRSAASNAATTALDVQRLRAENQQLRGGALTPAAPAAAPENYSRESWAFSGYASPESALISAIWAMKEGQPGAYLDSLSPEEQRRMAQIWQNRTEQEIAEKHKSDVAAISGLRVLELQNVSPNEVLLNVYLEGPGRVERIRMNQVGQDWKFGGFIREQAPGQ